MTMQRTPLLLSRLMDRGAWIAPREEVVTRRASGCHRYSYTDECTRAHRLAHALDERGIAVGDRVASFLWNGHRHLELYHAVPSMGAVLHTLNIRLSPRDLVYIVNHAADRIVFVDADLLPLMEKLAGELPTVELYVVCSDDPDWKTSLEPAIDYEDFIAGKSEHYDWPELDENAPMGLCYTSGTTGNPKGVMYTHRSTYLHTMAVAMTDVMSLSATDSVCESVPMFHAMSWGLPFTATMLGAKQVLPHRFMDPVGLPDLMASAGVTLSAGVPPSWPGLRAARGAGCGRASARARAFHRRAFEFLRAQPGAAAAGVARKAVRLLSAEEIHRNEDPYALRRESRLLSILLWRTPILSAPWGLVGPLALPGAVLAWPRRRRLWPFYLPGPAYAAAIPAFFVTALYRLPLPPPAPSRPGLGARRTAPRGAASTSGCAYPNTPTPLDSFPAERLTTRTTGVNAPQSFPRSGPVSMNGTRSVPHTLMRCQCP